MNGDNVNQVTTQSNAACARLHFVTRESDQMARNLIDRTNLIPRLSTTRNLADWSNLVIENFGAIGVLQLDFNDGQSNWASLLADVHRVSRQARGAVIFAVGRSELARIEKELLISGFAGVFCSNESPCRFARSATRHANSIDWQVQSVEQRVAEKLPWKPIASCLTNR